MTVIVFMRMLSKSKKAGLCYDLGSFESLP